MQGMHVVKIADSHGRERKGEVNEISKIVIGIKMISSIPAKRMGCKVFRYVPRFFHLQR